MHSIRPILPPHILHAIVERGTPSQREAAVRTLSIDATFRSLRVASPFGRATVSTDATSRPRRRTIYTARHGQELPGLVVASEQDPPSAVDDVAVREAFEGLGATWDFFHDVFDRDSIDDEGLRLEATVHYARGYNNAFWNGRQMVFGDGDGEIFNRFTASVDVIGHELGHGVTDDEGGLAYMFQPGALNESLSDVFGSLVKQKMRGQAAADADWLIGERLFTNAVHGRGLRSMQAPGTAYDDPVLGRDPQPAHMDDYVNTYGDNGGVHINSGIPNRAFFLSAMSLGGFAWDKAGRVWYEALRDPALRDNTGFRRFAKMTVSAADRLFGGRSLEARAVADAWATVGINVSAAMSRVA